jgi:hypothetical protein
VNGDFKVVKEIKINYGDGRKILMSVEIFFTAFLHGSMFIEAN